MPLPGALYTEAPIDPKTGRFTRAWLLWLNSLAAGTGVTAAPANAQYLVAVADPILTAERIPTNTASITWDFSTPAQAKANTVGTVINRVAISLSDAQIKALPTTPITVVAAPAAGSFVKLLAASLTVDSTAGAYTNINTVFCAAFGLAYGPLATSQQAAVAPLINDSSMTIPLTSVTTALNTALGARHVDYNVPNSFAYDAGSVSGGINWVFNPNDGTTNLYSAVALQVSTDNNGSGNFTGGNAANSARVTVYYAIEVL